MTKHRASPPCQEATMLLFKPLSGHASAMSDSHVCRFQSRCVQLEVELAYMQEQLRQFKSIQGKRGDEWLDPSSHSEYRKQAFYTEHYHDYSRFHAITITIDQSKYSPQIYEREELYYFIDNAIAHMTEYCNYIYFCIEHHQNGIPHAHLMVQFRNGVEYKDMETAIRPLLSDNKSNKRALHDEQKATSRWHDYINKDCPYGFPKYWRAYKDDWTPPPKFDQVPTLKLILKNNVIDTKIPYETKEQKLSNEVVHTRISCSHCLKGIKDPEFYEKKIYKYI